MGSADEEFEIAIEVSSITEKRIRNFILTDDLLIKNEIL
jgi:hypothetical protein